MKPGKATSEQSGHAHGEAKWTMDSEEWTIEERALENLNALLGVTMSCGRLGPGRNTSPFLAWHFNDVVTVDLASMLRFQLETELSIAKSLGLRTLPFSSSGLTIEERLIMIRICELELPPTKYDDPREYWCGFCDQEFDTLDELKRHERQP